MSKLLPASSPEHHAERYSPDVLPDLPEGESIGPRILFGDEQAAPGSDDE